MQREFRLRQSRDFARLRTEGRAYHDRSLVVSVMPNGLSHNRYGFVTRKALGQAVIRNRTRRLMREAVRLLHSQLSPGFDVALVARQPLVGETFQAVQRIISKLLEQAGVVKGGDG